jgi:hypothetical protein
MEVWTFINKISKEIIRFDVIYTDDQDFGTEYFFTTGKYSPIWFVHTEEEAKIAFKDFVHPQFSMFFETPSTEKININDFEIVKFKMEEK